MIQISEKYFKPFWSLHSERVTKILPSPTPTPLDPALKRWRNKGHRNIGNLFLGVNSVTVSYLIHYNSLLKKCDRYYYKMRQLFYHKMQQKFIPKCLRFFITKCNNSVTKCDSNYRLWRFYYKMRCLLQIAMVNIYSWNKYICSLKKCFLIKRILYVSGNWIILYNCWKILVNQKIHVIKKTIWIETIYCPWKTACCFYTLKEASNRICPSTRYSELFILTTWYICMHALALKKFFFPRWQQTPEVGKFVKKVRLKDKQK